MQGRIRSISVYLICLVVLLVFAGRERLTQPSHDNHYSHLAAAWLDGRLHHEGKPPGWCTPERQRAKQCRHHAMNDWAVVWTLETKQGERFRGYPCKTEACLAKRRQQGVERWWLIGEDEPVEFRRGEIRGRTDTWYVSFPPGPALFLLPAVAIWGVGVWDVLITCLLAACIPVVLLRWFDRERGSEAGRDRDHLWAVAAFSLASPALLLGANGRVWFTAQIIASLCTCLYLACTWKLRRPAAAGLWLALAVSCRPHLALMVIVFGAEWWRAPRDRSAWLALLRFATPIVIVGSALMAMNHHRFGDVLEFGHRFLEIRWQPRMQEHGSFSTEYLLRNLRCAFSLMPVWQAGPRVSIHGSSSLLGSPWLLALVWARDPLPQRWPLLISAMLVALPSLLYQNSGQLQFSYRFALDWLPLLLAAIVFGGGARGPGFRALVLGGALWQAYGAWMFGRKPAELFVTEPMGWPFESEFE